MIDDHFDDLAKVTCARRSAALLGRSPGHALPAAARPDVGSAGTATDAFERLV